MEEDEEEQEKEEEEEEELGNWRKWEIERVRKWEAQWVGQVRPCCEYFDPC